MTELARDLRDRAVWVLARLSLVVLLSMMGALFVGSAAQGNTGRDSSAAVQVQQAEAAQSGVLEGANPVAIAIVALMLVGGMGVLLVGALKPQRLGDQRELAELLRD